LALHLAPAAKNVQVFEEFQAETIKLGGLETIRMQDTPDLQLTAVVAGKKVAHSAKHVLSLVTAESFTAESSTVESSATESFTAESSTVEPDATAGMATQSAPQETIADFGPARSCGPANGTHQPPVLVTLAAPASVVLFRLAHSSLRRLWSPHQNRKPQECRLASGDNEKSGSGDTDPPRPVADDPV